MTADGHRFQAASEIAVATFPSTEEKATTADCNQNCNHRVQLQVRFSPLADDLSAMPGCTPSKVKLGSGERTLRLFVIQGITLQIPELFPI